MRSIPYAVLRSVLGALLLCLAGPLAAQPYAYVAGYYDGNVSVIDTATNAVIATPSLAGGYGTTGVALHPDGSKAYFTNIDTNNLSVLDTATLAAYTVPLPQIAPYGMTVSTDGSRGYVLGINSDNLAVLDLTTNPVSVLTTVGGLNGPINGVLSPDGSHLYVVEHRGGSIAVVDTGSLSVSHIPLGYTPYGLALSADGETLWVGAYFALVRIQDPDGVASLTPYALPGTYLTDVALNPDGSRLYANDLFGYQVLRFDTATGNIDDSGPAGIYPIGLALTPDGSRVYAVNSGSNNVSVLDADLNPVATIPVGSTPYANGSFILTPPRQEPPTAANLRLSFSGPVTTVRSGVSVPVALRLDNYGPDPADSPMVEISTSAPPGSITLTAPAGWSCEQFGSLPTASRSGNAPQAPAGTGYSCSLDGDMPRGSARFSLATRAPANPPGGFVSFNATAASRSVDAQPDNNSASYKLYVKPTPVAAPVVPGIR